MNALTHRGTHKAHQQDKNKATTTTTASTQQHTTDKEMPLSTKVVYCNLLSESTEATQKYINNRNRKQQTTPCTSLFTICSVRSFTNTYLCKENNVKEN